MEQAQLVQIAFESPTKTMEHVESFDWVNRIGALVLLFATAPLFILIGGAILLTSGRPIFYRGARLGKGKQTFDMYKFRSLRVDAEQIIGSRLLNGSMDLTTPFGKWLRGTRLDELPQLVNILKGDMDFIGPRPERQSVYEAHCREIPGYDLRFTGKPGLVGYAQVFTPHGTPKSIRAKVDNLLATKPRTEMEKFRFITYTAWLVLLATLYRVGEAAKGVLSILGKRNAAHQRKQPREKPASATARVMMETDCKMIEVYEMPIVDMNEKAMRIRSSEPVFQAPTGDVELYIEIMGRNGRRQTRTARCHGTTQQVRASDQGGVDFVVAYETKTPVSEYNVQQYFLRNSIARAGRS